MKAVNLKHKITPEEKKRLAKLAAYEKQLRRMPLKEYYLISTGRKSSPELLQKDHRVIFNDINHKYLETWWSYCYQTDFLNALISHSNKGDTQTTEWILDKINKMNVWASTYKRVYNTIRILFILPIDRIDNVCTVFSIQRKGVSRSINYAYLYSTRNKQHIREELYYHSYACIGPYYTSSDGEYRPRFMKYESIKRQKRKYPELWNEIEQYLIEQQESLNFTLNYYFKEGTPRATKKQFQDDIDNSRISIDLFIMAWFAEGFLKHLGLQSGHIKSIYNKNMFSKDTSPFLDKLISSFGFESLKKAYTDSNQVSKSHDIYNISRRVGQKIVPITPQEKLHVYDVEYPIWLEHYISSQATRLVLNNVCPGVPILYEWFVIYKANKMLFNNDTVYNRMVMSDNAAELDRKINKASASSFSLDTTDIEKDRIRRISVLHPGESKTKVYNSGVVFLSEYVGSVFNDLRILLKSDRYPKENIMSRFPLFKKFMFDIIYSLYCLNTKIDVIHGDLHLNNIAIHMFYRRYNPGETPKNIKNLKTIYVIEDKYYITDFSPEIGTVIDFSRSFLSPRNMRRNNVIGNPSIIKKNQILRIVAYYEEMFPAFMKANKTRFMHHIDLHFNDVFKIFSAVDSFILTDRMMRFIKKNNDLKIHPRILPFVKKINDIARRYMVDILKDVVYGKDIKEVPWPNLFIIEQCYSDYVMDKNYEKKYERHVLADVFNYDNSLTKSLTRFKDFPKGIACLKMMKPGEHDVTVDLTDTLHKMKERVVHYRYRDGHEDLLIQNGIP